MMKGCSLRFRPWKDYSNAQLLQTQGMRKTRESRLEGEQLAQSTGQDRLCGLFLKAGKIPGFGVRGKMWSMGYRKHECKIGG